MSAAGNERSVIDTFRVITDDQYTYFYDVLTDAVSRMGGSRVFTVDDEGIVASYLYILLTVVGHWSNENNPYDVVESDTSYSDRLFTMDSLYATLSNKYKRDTVRRYVTDLTKFKLIRRDGRGDGAWVCVSMQAVWALATVIRHWVAEMLTIEQKLRDLGAFEGLQPTPRGRKVSRVKDR